MYRPNIFYRNVLIIGDEVVFHAPTAETVDRRKLEASIIVAEERFFRTYLGYDFYEALAAQKNRLVTLENKAELEEQINASFVDNQEPITLRVGELVNAVEFLSAENKKLWFEHLWKICAECVLMLAMPDYYVDVTAAGLVHNTPPAGPMNTGGAVSPSLNTVKWSMDKKMLDRIAPLMDGLHQFLCKEKQRDKALYSLYTKSCGCDEPGQEGLVANKRRSNWVIGIYDDNSQNCCNGWDQLRPL